MSNSLPPPPEGLDPVRLMGLNLSFVSARMLAAGVELGLFERLADGPLNLDELARATGLLSHTLAVLANGLVALHILELRGGCYVNGADAQAFLTGRTSIDLRPGLRLDHRIIYPMWTQFEDTVRTGEPARPVHASEEFSRTFSEGIESWTSITAAKLPDRYDFARHKRLLDIGGGTGSYLVRILERHPQMQATLFELPPPAEIARGRLAEQPTRARIDIVEGDALFDPLPGGHDIVLVAAVMHLFDARMNVQLLGRVRQCVAAGATLLLVDHWMNSEHTEPLLGAILSGTYLLLSGHASAHGIDEAKDWLAHTGWRFASFQPVSGEHSLIVAEAE